jgi:argininosuccinate lyase
MRAARFAAPMNSYFRALNASIGFDKRLLREDIEGSRAWVGALSLTGLLSDDEAKTIVDGLEAVRRGIESGELPLSEDLEDIHMNVESLLAESIGSVAGKLHTGRSRNEQVVTDLRLYLRGQSRRIAMDTLRLVEALTATAEANIDVVIPAYTHLQRAQPVLFAHHLLAYAEMFLRDHERLLWAADQADVCALGAGACAGNQFGIDRDYLRRQLNFSRLTHNSLDAVSDRDFVCDFLHAAVMFLVHVSRLSEDIILWSSSEFGFVDLDESIASGSSMLPQKKNPDACELGRAKCGRVLGHFVAVVSMLKGLPLSYNKDLQEDKEGAFDAVDTLSLLVPVFEVVVRTIRVNRERAAAALEGGYLDAISVADYLTRRGMPFRKAHALTGRAVRLAQQHGVSLGQLTIDDYRDLARDPEGEMGGGIEVKIEEDLFEAITLEAALESKDVVGGTAPKRVASEIDRIRTLIETLRSESLSGHEVRHAR